MRADVDHVGLMYNTTGPDLGGSGGMAPGPPSVGPPTRQIVLKQPIRRGRTYKNSTKNAPKLAILSSKNEIFFWEGAQPLPRPLPSDPLLQ